MQIEEIYNKIQGNNIGVFSLDIKDLKAISIKSGGKYGIFINYDEIKDKEEEFMVATHEYGHCMTGSTHPPYSPLDIIAKHEYKADRKAVLDFLPVEAIKDAIEHGCRSTYEFAEYLDVPERFVVKAFQHYNAMELI